MIALYNFPPLYCPSCGTPSRLDRMDNPMSGKFKTKLAMSCAICGVMDQLVGNTDCTVSDLVRQNRVEI